MKNTITYTSTISAELLEMLNMYAKKFKVPKNQIIEKALKAYINRLKRAEYVRSFKYAKNDKEITRMAEEGLEDYLRIIDKE